MALDKETSDSKEKKPKQAIGGQPLVLLALLLSALSLLGVGYLQLNAASSSKLNQVVSVVNTKLIDMQEKVSSANEVHPDKIASIKADIVQDVQSTIGSKVDERIKTTVEQSINDYDITVEEKLSRLPTTSVVNSSGLSDQQIKKIIDSEFTKFEIKSKTQAAQFHQRVDELSLAITDVEGQIETMKLLVANPKNQSDTPKLRKRLKEFNILLPVLKDGTLFVIDAPLKNGKENSITLTVGEPFRSKFGSHKVEGVQKTKDGVRLLVSGGYFIDETREEFSKAELNAISAAQHKPKPKKTQSKSTAKAPTPDQASIDDTHLSLKDWYVVTTMPATKEVIVYNPESNAPMRLSKNLAVSGIGTVKSIDFKSGRTCFEKYCIRGLEL